MEESLERVNGRSGVGKRKEWHQMVMIKGADLKSVVHACMYGEYGMHFCCPRKKYDTRYD